MDHLKVTIEHLLKNKLSELSDLIVFSDGATDNAALDGVQEVRKYLRSINGFKSIKVVERSKNFGLAENIIQGITTIFETYPKIIALEDDMASSPYFLQYMNQALDYYEKNEEVISIHGYVYPLKEKMKNHFFLRGADCWGWGTWKRGWDLFERDGSKLLSELLKNNLQNEFNFNQSYNYVGMLKDQISGKNNSWALRWYASAFLKNKLTLYQKKSFSNNIGFDGNGTHCDVTSDFLVELEATESLEFPKEILASKAAFEAFCNFFRSIKPSLFKRITSKLKSMLKGRKK